MSRAIDALIAARLIKLLVTPFKKTKAYEESNSVLSEITVENPNAEQEDKPKKKKEKEDEKF